VSIGSRGSLASAAMQPAKGTKQETRNKKQETRNKKEDEEAMGLFGKSRLPMAHDSKSDVQRIGSSLSLIVFALVVVLAGLISGRFMILWVGFFLVVIGVLAETMATLTFRHLTVRHHFQSLAAEIDQPMSAELIVENPLPWSVGQIEWQLDVPEPLRFYSLAQSFVDDSHGHWRLHGTLMISRQERLRVLLELRGMRRGRFRVGTTTVEFSDPLHWGQWMRRAHLDERLITIWPRRLSLPSGFWSHASNLGDIHGRLWDPPDPVLIAGIRPYRPGEPARRIHAFASARSGQLMVKEDEHLLARTIEVILHPQSTAYAWKGLDSQALEDCISLAATVVEASLTQGLDVGLVVSGAVAGHSQGLNFRPRHGPGVLEQMLTALAWTEPSDSMSSHLIDHLAELTRRISRDSLVVLVAPFWPDEVRSAWAALMARGVKPVWITNARTYGQPLVLRPVGVHTVWRWSDGEWSRE